MKGLFKVFRVSLALYHVTSSTELDDLGEYNVIEVYFYKYTLTVYRTTYPVKTFNSCTKYEGTFGILHNRKLDYHFDIWA